ncbi:MAG: sugar phosphate isomerase/epimerase family protein, partial [Ruthenibacterium sp.]
LCAVQDRLSRLGLTAFSMSGHCNLMDVERLPDFVTNMRLAHFFGCRYLVSSVGEAHLKDKATASDERLSQNLKALVPELEKYDLTLVLELHGAHATGEVMQKIVRLVASPRVKINYDTANCLFYGGVKAEEDVDVCMQEIAYLHLKDKAGAPAEWDFPALGKGYVDFETIFRKLASARNNAPFSVEIEFTKAGPKNLCEVNEAVRLSAEYLRQHGFSL